MFEVVDQAVAFVMSHIDARVGERTQSAQVDVAYELPVQAVTETIVNACVHRDYLSTGSVQVMLFKDKLEVWNPGRLPKGMTIEKLAGEHASLPVNPLLANPVCLAGYIEQVGTGTNDVIDRCVELGLRKPEFRQDKDFTAVMWRKKMAETGNEGVNGELNGELNTAQKATLNYIKENEGCNATEISAKTGVPFSTSDKHIRVLLKKGVIERRGSKKTGGYYAKE